MQQQQQQLYENFKAAVMMHYTQTSTVEQKQQSFQFLQQFDADPNQWIICAQLIIEQDEMLQFFGYKYVYNILVYMPTLISSAEYELIQQKIITNICSNTEGPQHSFLLNKQFQVLIQMVFQQIIQLDGFFSFCLNGITTSTQEISQCSILKLFSMLFEQLNNSKIHYKKLTYQFKAQMEEYIKQNIPLIQFIEVMQTALSTTTSQQLQLQAIQALNQVSRIYIQQEKFKLNTQCAINLLQCYLNYSKIFQNDLLLLQHICEGVMSILSTDDTLVISQEGYQQTMFLFHKIIQTLQKQQVTEQFIQFFIMQFSTFICQNKIFKQLISIQLQLLRPQIGKENYLLSSKAQKDAFNYFEKGLTLSDNKNEGYLFYLLYTMLIIQSMPDNPDLLIPIQCFCECLLDNTKTLTKRFCTEFIKQLMPKYVEKIICTLQRPTTLKYYYNQQGYLERNDNNEYEDDQQYVEKLNIIELLYKVNTSLFKELIQKLIDEIVKKQNIFLLQQLSIAYPKIYQLNQEIANQIIFLALTFKSMIISQDMNDKESMIVLVNQLFLYMIKFNKKLLLDQNFAIQVMQQCFDIFYSDESYQLYEYAFNTLLEILTIYDGKNQNAQYIIQYLQDKHINSLFQLANNKMTVFQIQDLYSALLKLMPDYQRQIVEPVQQYSHENLHSLISSNVQLQQNEQNALVQLFSVLECIVKVVGIGLIENQLKDDVLQIATMFHAQNVANETLGCHIDVLLQLMCNQQSGLIQLLENKNQRLNELLQTDAEVASSDVGYLKIYQSLLEGVSEQQNAGLPQNSGGCDLCTMLLAVLECLISYQKRRGGAAISPVVQEATSAVMELFLRSGCRIYQRFILKNDSLRTSFLNCLVSVATSPELAGTEFSRLYLRQRSSIQVFILRRAGEQFLRFALSALTGAAVQLGLGVLGATGELFVMDLLEQSLNIIGAQEVATILGNVSPSVLNLITQGTKQQQAEALHDVLVSIGINQS